MTVNTLSYERLPRQFPWRSVRATLTFAGVCVTVQIVLPIFLLGYPPLVASVVMAIPILVLLLLLFRSAIRGRSKLLSAGFRSAGVLLILFSGFILLLATIETCAVVPVLAKRYIDASAFEQKRKMGTAFQFALLILNNYYLENGKYPGDLHVLLETKEANLSELFPVASPDDFSGLARIASEDTTLTQDQEQHIEDLANLNYYLGASKIDATAKEFLVLSSRRPYQGCRFVGYSSGRIETMPTADADKIISASGATGSATAAPK